LYQKLSKFDNWFSSYSQKCLGCFFGGHSVVGVVVGIVIVVVIVVATCQRSIGWCLVVVA